MDDSGPWQLLKNDARFVALRLLIADGDDYRRQFSEPVSKAMRALDEAQAG